jgi:multicomponent Na+:H+ antiporter subunit B
LKIRNVLIVILALIALYGIIISVAEMPPYGSPDNPVHNQVSERYIHKALEETGVLNMVTAIVLDYRAYDTMFETIVLFTAAIAVVINLKKYHDKSSSADKEDSLIK